MRSFHMTSHSSIERSAVRQRRVTTEALVWNEITIVVSYEADWLGLRSARFARAFSHLELQVLHPMGAPMPLGHGGYWSEFLEPGQVEAVGGPLTLALALLKEFADCQAWRVAWARWEQRDPD
jgi:hypothetical protein